MFFAFFSSLVIIALAVQFIPRLRTVLATGIDIAGARAFTSHMQEMPKFGLLRFIFGIIVSIRAWDILVLLAPSDYTNTFLMLYAVANLIAGLTLMCGLFTQYAIIYLVCVHWQIADRLLGTSTLGNDIGAMLAVLLFVVNSGRYFSVDSRILRYFKHKWLVPLLLYYGSTPTPRTITGTKLAALFSYWLVCVYSLSMHFNETAWMTGTAGPLLLSNNFMSAPHQFFEQIFIQSNIAVLLARVSLWIMMIWYVAVFPFVLMGGILRAYVIIWGLLFFALSLFVLQLGWLAEIEFVLWAALFWTTRGITRPQSFEVAFDDKCNLCDRTVQFIRRVDIFERVKLLPLSQNMGWLKVHEVSEERALEDLHGYDAKSNSLHAGYDFYIKLTREMVLLWPLFPILFLGKWTRIGPMLYRWVALRRRRLFGVCTLPSPKRAPLVYEEVGDGHRQSWFVSTIIYHVLFLGLCYAVGTPAPYLDHQGWKNRFARSAHIYGIAPINVFNHTDLGMAEYWFTLSLVEEDGETLLPILGEDGSRLSFHASDRVYFGNTLAFRRRYLEQQGCFFAKEEKRIRYLAAVYLHHMDMPIGEYTFHYRQYHEALPSQELLEQNQYVKNQREMRCEATFSLVTQ